MTPEEYRLLKEDIRLHGPGSSIIVVDGAILDGKHVWRAVEELLAEGVKVRRPQIEVWNAQKHGPTPLHTVLSRNLRRRQLRPGQATAILIDLSQRFPEYQAKIESLRQSARARELAGQTLASPDARGKFAKHLADLTGDKVATVERVLAVQRKGTPEDFQKVVSGEMTPTAAIRRIHGRNRVYEPLRGRYRIFYADPPWRYVPIGENQYLAPQDHYLTLSLEQICGIPVSQKAEPDAVLFLWSPTRNLANALTVMRAWGFEYRDEIIWRKDNSIKAPFTIHQHEPLLIGRRGSIMPVWTPPSIISAPHGRHSAKPEVVRSIIDRMFPEGRRVELFARTRAPGWEAWGDEVVAS
jgi:N6-adenosine-specific RNA methylase IME4